MILTAAVAVAAAVSSPFSGTPNPTFRVDTDQLTALTRGGFVRHTVAGPERFLSDPSSAALPNVLARDQQLWIGATAKTRGQRTAARYQAKPDFDGGPDDLGLQLGWFAVTEARAGRLTLIPDTLASRAVLRAEIDLPANSCRDQAEGTATIWLTRTTLLPKRLEVERDGKTQTWTYRFAGFNQVFGVLDPPSLGSNPERTTDRFHRSSPAAAAGPLPYVPSCRRCCPPASGSRRPDGRRLAPAPARTASTSVTRACSPRCT